MTAFEKAAPGMNPVPPTDTGEATFFWRFHRDLFADRRADEICRSERWR
jgi:hypothetical protein